MTIEITGAFINKEKQVEISAIDVSEEHLQRMERYRDDGNERILEFVFDTGRDKKACSYLVHWLHKQKATQGSKTYKEALDAVVGTVAELSGHYIVWD